MKAEAVYTVSDRSGTGVIHLDMLSGDTEVMLRKRFLFWKFWHMRMMYMVTYHPTWSTCVCTGTGIIAITDINLN